ncbi:MAG: hypothetical protein FWC86_05060 [Coriobacteriia bacterium]|nr:hypothetical protein [Coriobacteriia bacterium]
MGKVVIQLTDKLEGKPFNWWAPICWIVWLAPPVYLGYLWISYSGDFVESLIGPYDIYDLACFAGLGAGAWLLIGLILVYIGSTPTRRFKRQLIAENTVTFEKDVTVISKTAEVSGGETKTTAFSVSFDFPNNEHKTLIVDKNTFGTILENEFGVLTYTQLRNFQGTEITLFPATEAESDENPMTLVSFERKGTIEKPSAEEVTAEEGSQQKVAARCSGCGASGTVGTKCKFCRGVIE